jgi:hypothetical protein
VLLDVSVQVPTDFGLIQNGEKRNSTLSYVTGIHELGMFKSIVLRGISGPMREEETGGSR